jgi:hypothetical protein
MSLNDKKTLPTRKSTKQKETQVADMKNLAKIISIVTTYVFLVENKSLLNKKSTNHKETNRKTRTTTSSLTSNTLLSLVLMNYWSYLISILSQLELQQSSTYSFKYDPNSKQIFSLINLQHVNPIYRINLINSFWIFLVSDLVIDPIGISNKSFSDACCIVLEKTFICF